MKVGQEAICTAHIRAVTKPVTLRRWGISARRGRRLPGKTPGLPGGGFRRHPADPGNPDPGRTKPGPDQLTGDDVGKNVIASHFLEPEVLIHRIIERRLGPVAVVDGW